jgi:hypothetical protein
MMIAVVVTLLVLFLLIRTMTKESFTDTSYYYSAAPGSRGERLVCMPESQGHASLGVALKNAALRLNSCSAPTTQCNTTTTDPAPPMEVQTVIAPYDQTMTQCPPGSYWNGSSCTGMLDVPMCSPGFQWDGVQCRQVVLNQQPTVSCPQGYQWNGSSCTKTSPGCQPGMIWDAKRGVCRYPSGGPIPSGVPSCPKGYKYDASIGMCVKTSPGCPTGSIWDGKGCRRPKNPRPPIAVGPSPGGVIRQPTCPAKYSYDAKTRMCLKTDPGCPPGQIYDKKIGRCRLPQNPRPSVPLGTPTPQTPLTPTCPAKYSYDPKTRKCLKTDPGCPAGQIYDKKIGRCRLPKNPRPSVTPGSSSAPSSTPAPAGKACKNPDWYKYDAASGLCLKTDPGCPAGHIFDKKNGRCRLPSNPRPSEKPIETEEESNTSSKTPTGYVKLSNSIQKKLGVSGKLKDLLKQKKQVTRSGLKLRYKNSKMYMYSKRTWLRIIKTGGTWYIAKAKESYEDDVETFEDQLLNLLDG